MSADQAWLQWRQELPDFDYVEAAEIALLPYAWSRAESSGAADPDAGRIAGLRRRSYLVGAAVVSQLVSAQAELAALGVTTAVSGGVAAMLHYPALARPGPVGAELLIESHRSLPQHFAATLAEKVAGRKSLAVSRGSADLPEGVLLPSPIMRWRQPDLRPVADMLGERVVTRWQGRQVDVLAPHVIAYGLLLRTFLRYRPGEASIPSWVVDFDRLSSSADFCADEFTRLVISSGWRKLFAAHGETAVDYLSPERRALLDGAGHRAVYATGPGAARIHGVAVRVATRGGVARWAQAALLPAIWRFGSRARRFR